MIRTYEDWLELRRDGRNRFLLRQGVLRRALPMALITVLVIQAAQGGLDPAALRSGDFHLRFLIALAVFSLGGVLSAYAQWRALERRFGSSRGTQA